MKNLLIFFICFLIAKNNISAEDIGQLDVLDLPDNEEFMFSDDSYDIDIFSIRFNQLKLGILTTWNKKCGIAIYMSHIFNAMKQKRLRPVILPYDLPFDRIIKRIELNELQIINIQYEPSLFSDQMITRVVKILKSKNIKVVITVHWEGDILKSLEKDVDLFLYHKPPKLSIKNFFVIPMGVPVFEPKEDKINTRLKYNYKTDDIIITTTGFLLPWKEYSSILDKLAPYIKLNTKFKVQFLTSFNDITKDECEIELKKINKVIKKYDLSSQIKIITNFIPQLELSERLWISDIGYLWGNLDSRGSSASMKEFISARLPLITTKSSHFHDINRGVIKTAIDKDIFVHTILEIVKDSEKLKILRYHQEILYRQLNYCNLIERYINIFKGLS